MADHLYPIGPAPEGWHRMPGCSRVFPHTEGDAYQNDEMNAEHCAPLPDVEDEPAEDAWQPSPLATLLWELATAEMRMLTAIAGSDEEGETNGFQG